MSTPVEILRARVKDVSGQTADAYREEAKAEEAYARARTYRASLYQELEELGEAIDAIERDQLLKTSPPPRLHFSRLDEMVGSAAIPEPEPPAPYSDVETDSYGVPIPIPIPEPDRPMRTFTRTADVIAWAEEHLELQADSIRHAMSMGTSWDVQGELLFGWRHIVRLLTEYQTEPATDNDVDRTLFMNNRIYSKHQPRKLSDDGK